MCHHEGQTPLPSDLSPTGLLCGFLAWGCRGNNHHAKITFSCVGSLTYGPDLRLTRSWGSPGKNAGVELPCGPPGIFLTWKGGIEHLSLLRLLHLWHSLTTATWKLEWVYPFSVESSTRGSSPDLPHCRSGFFTINIKEPSNRWQKQAWEAQDLPCSPRSSVSSCHMEKGKTPGWSNMVWGLILCLVLSEIYLRKKIKYRSRAIYSGYRKMMKVLSPALKDLWSTGQTEFLFHSRKGCPAHSVQWLQPWNKQRGHKGNKRHKTICFNDYFQINTVTKSIARKQPHA